MASNFAYSEHTNVVTLMITKSNDEDNDDSNNILNKASVIGLVHPNTGEQHHFVRSCCHQDTKGKSLTTTSVIYEMQAISRPYGSFLVGSRVVSSPSSSSLHVLTPVDPLFFALHALSNESSSKEQEQQHQFQPLDQLPMPQVVQEALESNMEQWKHLCAVTTLGGNNDHTDDDSSSFVKLYKFEPSRALEWLVQKQRAALDVVSHQMLEAKCLKSRATRLLLSQDGGAFSKTFRYAEEDEDDNTNKDNAEDGMAYAAATTTTTTTLTRPEHDAAKEASLQVVCDYLSPMWQTKLREHLNMPEVVTTSNKTDSISNNSKKRGAPWEDDTMSKPPTLNPGQDYANRLIQFTTGESDENANNKQQTKTDPAQSAGLKRLAKVNTKGMKSLSSFFTAKKKKTTHKSTNTEKD